MESSKLGLYFEEFEVGAEIMHNLSKTIFESDNNFFCRYNIRPSCFKCRYRNLKRGADFTLDDFGAIETYNSEYDDNKGTSFVLTNTKKAVEILNKLDIVRHCLDIDLEKYSNKFNWCMHRNPYNVSVKERKQFYDDVKILPFNEMAMKDLEVIRQYRKQKKLKTKQIRYE